MTSSLGHSVLVSVTELLTSHKACVRLVTYSCYIFLFLPKRLMQTMIFGIFPVLSVKDAALFLPLSCLDNIIMERVPTEKPLA